MALQTYLEIKEKVSALTENEAARSMLASRFCALSNYPNHYDAYDTARKLVDEMLGEEDIDLVSALQLVVVTSFPEHRDSNIQKGQLRKWAEQDRELRSRVRSIARSVGVISRDLE